MNKDEIYLKLKRPFDAKQISWRVGATDSNKTQGIALAYVDARDVMQRLDDVFGLNWQCRYSHAENKTICEIGVCIDGEWIWRAGGAGDTDVEAEKGAISDAFKRAAVLFGVARYLYSLPNKWVPIDSKGKSYVLKEHPALPAWATPEGFDAIMKKRAAANGVITPKTGVWEELSPDMQIFLSELAEELKAMLGKGDINGAKTHLQAANLGADEETALWTKLDSKHRSTLKLKEAA
jgi:hypothetical protein